MSIIWNHKISGLFGACCTAASIVCRMIADKFTTIVVSHNMKSCGKNVVIMHGLTYRNSNNITIGNDVIIGANGSLTSEIATSGGCVGGGICL